MTIFIFKFLINNSNLKLRNTESSYSCRNVYYNVTTELMGINAIYYST